VWLLKGVASDGCEGEVLDREGRRFVDGSDEGSGISNLIVLWWCKAGREIGGIS